MSIQAPTSDELSIKLEGLLQRVQSARPLIVREQHHRARSQQDCSRTLALDFDVIFPFLRQDFDGKRPRSENDTLACDLVSSLLAEDRVRLTLLPGTLHEVAQYSARLLGTSTQWTQALNGFSPADVDSLAQASNVRRALSKWSTTAGTVLANLELLGSVLRRAENDSVSKGPDLKWDPSGQQRRSREALHLLMRYRPDRNRKLANLVDASNLALVVDAAERGLDFGLVTQMHAATHVFEALWVKNHKDSPPPLMVLPPRLAMLRLGLAGASAEQIQTASDSLRRIEALAKSYIAGPRSRQTGLSGALEEIAHAERHLVSLFSGLLDLPVAVSVAWERPAEVLPDDVDLDRLVVCARDASLEIEKQVLRVLREARRLFKDALAAFGGDAHTSEWGKQLTPLLRAAAEDSSEPAYRFSLVDTESHLDSESKERLLVGQVIKTVALANQLSRELSVSDHGIDMEIEFKDDSGHATGKKLYLQLKSGDSYLRRRKKDNSEVFRIKNPRHAEYWRNQAFPVFLVLRSSDGIVRWMEVRDYLRNQVLEGRSAAKQIEFNGEPFTVSSVLHWRSRALRVSSREEL